ncbi:hypothetical protein LUZ60_010992 [Juncus effusus]|nr:hypothetical protein LUZ60_010992 [Juncus effusus]
METTTTISTVHNLLEIQESEVLIDFKPLSKCRSDLHLRSLHPLLPIFFKIQTWAPHKFHVNPPSGSLAPLSTFTIQVILRPQTLPPRSSSSDRFLIRSSVSPTDLDCPVVSSLFNSNNRLRVVYIGSYLLRLAISTGDSASMRLILSHQPELLSVEQSRSPIHLSTSTGDYNSLLKSIETANTNELQSRDREGRIVLHPEVERGRVNCARRLFERGGRENDTESFNGRSGLYLAAANGDAEMVAMLLEMGADRTVGNERGRLPIDVARDKGHQDVVDILKRWERIMKATRRGDLHRLESLLKKRTGVAGRDQYGNTALHLAAIKGRCDIILLLIDHGMDVHTVDDEGHVALHLAVESGRLDAVELLVSFGADVNKMTKRGMTALDMADLLGHDDIARFLVSRGAIQRAYGDSVSVFVSPVISRN